GRVDRRVVPERFDVGGDADVVADRRALRWVGIDHQRNLDPVEGAKDAQQPRAPISGADQTNAQFPPSSSPTRYTPAVWARLKRRAFHQMSPQTTASASRASIAPVLHSMTTAASAAAPAVASAKRSSVPRASAMMKRSASRSRMTMTVRLRP